ncbi:ovochymase-1 [Pelobates cultripes]|uniref:Ovochymase-2 n=1 Tax=Pelobates cultripes TaxID=61616 RepID=A0AAD1RQN3_PELCU|nr:ovochymase-1 [Pelobates cultripes]
MGVILDLAQEFHEFLVDFRGWGLTANQDKSRRTQAELQDNEARLCGFTSPPPVFSPNNTMFIHFITDQENNYPGFKARFDFIQQNLFLLPVNKFLMFGAQQKSLSQDVCGIAPLSPQWMLPRIVGGEEACPNCWPWQVALLFLDTFQCGGVIISPHAVLSAAHCIQSLDPSHWFVIAGKHDRSLNEPTEQMRAVRMVHVHEKFNLKTFDYDMVFLWLEKPLEFNDFVRPICMPSVDEPLAPSSVCVVTGWGNIQEGGPGNSPSCKSALSQRGMEQLQVPIVDINVCNKTYYEGVLTERMVCAGFPSTIGRNSCQGDSGGPLVCPSMNKSFVLYGLVSWGVGCATGLKPFVYAKVREFLSWIQTVQQVEEEGNQMSKPKKQTLKSLASEDKVTVNHAERCGSLISPEVYVSHGPVVRVSFHTSAKGSYGKGGFAMIFRKYGGQVVSAEGACEHRKGLRVHIGGAAPSRAAVEKRLALWVHTAVTPDLSVAVNSPDFHDEILTSNNGAISSPGYPSNYPNDLSCHWRIVAPLRNIIRLDLLKLKTEKNASGCLDQLLIYEGTGKNKTLLGSYCGQMQLFSLKSDGPEMTLVFTTNSIVTMSGFTLKYSFWELQPDRSQCSLDAQRKAAVTACPILDLLPAGSAEIMSPHYPEIYPNGVDCQWLIYSTSGLRLRLLINDLYLEESANCTWDYLKVFDGSNNVSKLIVSLCGLKTDLNVESTGSYLLLHFYTDKSLGYRGFRINYWEISEPSILTSRILENTCNNGNPTEDECKVIGRASVFGEDCQGTGAEPTVLYLTEPASLFRRWTKKEARGRGRISTVVGGQTAPSKSWPWIASLQTRSRQHYCGGTVLSEKWILTAAHCEFRVGTDRLFVGQTDLSLGNDLEAFVINSYEHPSYDQDVLPPNNDITLLEVYPPLLLGTCTFAACVLRDFTCWKNTEKAVPLYASCMTAGWGVANILNYHFPKMLQQATISLLSIESCLDYWGSDVTDGNVCTGGMGATSCMGDSGGPLICKVENQYMLVGVVSWGSDECDFNAPTVYNNVFAYREWICQYIGC